VIVLGLALLVAMGLSTTVKTAEEGAKVASGLDPAKGFSAADFAAKIFPEIQSALPGKAVDIAILAPEVAVDVAAAGKKYGQDLGAGSYAVPVKAVGTVASVDDKFITITVDGMPEGTSVVVPIGTVLNGGPIRDALGNVRFGDVPDQIAFQSVAQEIKALIKTKVLDPANPASLNGKTVTVFGAWKSGGPKTTFIIQPTAIEAGS
jgi:predicted lipoprotein